MKVILIILSSLVVLYIGYRTYRFMTIAEGLGSKIANGAIILDVRTTDEYKTGHIDGSVNISLGTIRERYIEFDSTKTYITTCSHGLRSVKAESLLKERGFKKVYNGGAWTDLQKIVKEQNKEQ
ncbi:rhodanese-like domain-containing protein [Taibaiella lutea]|uniref:Rhodanese-like domain-containing protein n=1 Tax=Taibaiella lutea TaxID=2608001 RepID=A0A5M6CBW0_9BACT|nr:rhodanese-like domain-containing protein [Taibaiella lutea]KAA5532541.1 rhodanese-like domain-containing protein [Taibaiella lutea]